MPELSIFLDKKLKGRILGIIFDLKEVSYNEKLHTHVFTCWR